MVDPSTIITASAVVGGASAWGLVDLGLQHAVRVSPTKSALVIGGKMAREEMFDDTKSGREMYLEDEFQYSKRMACRAWDEATGRGDGLLVEKMYKESIDGPCRPVLKDRDTSMMVLGQTGTGKSTFVKSRIDQWPDEDAMVVHALSELGRHNEFAEFFESRGRDVIRLSSRNSDARWNPFEDFESSSRGMGSIAEAIFDADMSKHTGWDEPAKTLLVAALIITDAKYGDFARLPDVLERGGKWIIDEVQQVPNARLVAEPLTGIDRRDLGKIYNKLVNKNRGLLECDIFNQDLPTISIEEFFADPGNRVLVFDNVRKDRYARPFWRFAVQSAIDLASMTAADTRFVLDEVDKLPMIDNLDGLVSAGRSTNTTGIIVAQDCHQLKDHYGDMAFSIWSNCPNGVAFRVGDRETAKMVLGQIPEVEMREQTSTAGRGLAGEANVTQSVADKSPILPSDLTSLDTGEALLQSESGWWLCKLPEPELSVESQEDDES